MAAAPKLTNAERYKIREVEFLRRELQIYIAVPSVIWLFYFLKYLALARNIKLVDHYVKGIEQEILKDKKVGSNPIMTLCFKAKLWRRGGTGYRSQ
jgi:hypothetical protein